MTGENLIEISYIERGYFWVANQGAEDQKYYFRCSYPKTTWREYCGSAENTGGFYINENDYVCRQGAEGSVWALQNVTADNGIGHAEIYNISLLTSGII
jgi:hypothetical protein